MFVPRAILYLIEKGEVLCRLVQKEAFEQGKKDPCRTG